MKCPNCETGMHTGSATVETSTLGDVLGVVNLLTGHYSSLPHYLYFRGAGGGQALSVDLSGAAHSCPKCQTLVVLPAKMAEEAP
jgi:hypothetical protein